MKGVILVFWIILTSSQSLFAQERANYDNGNGTIIYEREDTNSKILIRKCEVDVIIGDLARTNQKIIYDGYETKNIIGQLRDDDNIKVLEIVRIDYFNRPQNDWGHPGGELWYKIKQNTSVGWLCINSEYISSDPYNNNRWEIIEIIESSGNKWTIRKMNQMVAVWENLHIRESPGVSGNKVIYTIRPSDTDPYQTNVEVIAMTEEVETIDGYSDHWLKIEYKEYVGWIFGGYTTVGRGGPKYHIPESKIKFELGWY